jgi:hypothetical protein
MNHRRRHAFDPQMKELRCNMTASDNKAHGRPGPDPQTRRPRPAGVGLARLGQGHQRCEQTEPEACGGGQSCAAGRSNQAKPRAGRAHTGCGT